MKKIIQILLVVTLSLTFVLPASAKTNSKLLAYAKETHLIGNKLYTLSSSDLVKVERFLATNDISDRDADIIISKANSIKMILNSENVSDITKLRKAKKDEIFTLAKEAASTIGITLTYDNSDKVIVLYKDGVKIEALSLNPYLKQTGKSNNLILGLSLTLILSTGLIFIGKRKNA